MGFAASDAVRERIKQAGAEFRANQNIAGFLKPGDRDALLRKKFGPLDAAVWVRRDRAAHLTALEYAMMVSDDEWILFPWETPDNAADDEARFRDARRPASGVRAPGQ